MGLSSSSKTTTTKPVYDQQITGAANTVSNAYNATAPSITANANAIGGLVPDLVSKYTNGDPTVNAAKAYDTDVLSGKYLDAGNPYLQQQIDATNNSVRNSNEAALGTRGLVGGSDYANIIARALAQNETNLRYTDYSNERQRMDAAASNAPSVASAGYLPLQAAISAATAGAAPLTAAQQYGSTIGGLLGPYTTTTEKSNQSIGGLLTSLLGSAASAYGAGLFGGGGLGASSSGLSSAGSSFGSYL